MQSWRAAQIKTALEADDKLKSEEKHKSVARMESLLTHVTESHPERYVHMCVSLYKKINLSATYFNVLANKFICTSATPRTLKSICIDFVHVNSLLTLQ